MFLQYGGGISFLFSSFSIYIYYDSLIFLKNLIKKYFLPLLHVMQNKLPLLMKSYIDQNKGLSCWLNHKLKTSLANFFNDQVNENKVYKISYCHCVKSVQIRRFFWSVLSSIRTEYAASLRTHSKCRKIWTRKTSLFEHFSLSVWYTSSSDSFSPMSHILRAFYKSISSPLFILTTYCNNIWNFGKTWKKNFYNFFSRVSKFPWVS